MCNPQLKAFYRAFAYKANRNNPQVIIKKYIILQKFETAFQPTDNEAEIGRNNGDIARGYLLEMQANFHCPD